MKSLLFYITLSITSTFAFAQNSSLKKIVLLEKKGEQNVKTKAIFSSRNSNAKFVPLLTKESLWEKVSASWQGDRSIKRVYTNNLLETEYILNYNQTDTISQINYSYDSNNFITSLTVKLKTSTGIFTNDFRYLTTYFSNYKGYITRTERWDELTGMWDPHLRQTSEVDLYGNTTKNILESNINGEWKILYAYKTFYSYLNNSSKLLSKYDSTYSNSTNKFEIDYATTRSYNSNNEVICVNQYLAANLSEPLMLLKVDSLYYENNIPTKLISFIADQDSLLKSRKLEDINWYNFNNSIDIFENDVVSFTQSSWQDSIWLNDFRLTNNYIDNYGSVINQRENYINNEWVFDTKYINLYDSYLNEIEYSESAFNIDSNKWELLYGERRNINYDVQNNIESEIVEKVNQTSKNWEYSQKIEHFDYINISTGINTSRNTIETKLFPNPSNDGKVFVNVKMEKSSDLKIDIIDLNGKTISSQTQKLGMGMNTIELKGLNHGLYFVVLTSDFGVSRTKLMVK